MYGRFKELNTLRNQIFIGFLLVMLIIIFVSGAFVYNRVSILLKIMPNAISSRLRYRRTGVWMR